MIANLKDDPMATILTCPKLSIAPDVKKLIKDKKLASKNLNKIKDTAKSAIADQSKLFGKHFDALIAEAESAWKNMEKLALERTTKLAGMPAQVGKLAKLQRDTIIAARKAGEASLASFEGAFDEMYDIADLLRDEPQTADIKAFLASLQKRVGEFDKAGRGLRTQMESIVLLDTKSSAKMKEIMVLTNGYNNDTKMFDKKIGDLGKKLGSTLEQFRGSLNRIANSENEEEFKKNAEVSVKFIPAMKAATDALIALRDQHPNRAAANPDPDKLLATLRGSFEKMNEIGLSVLKDWARKNKGQADSIYLSGSKLNELQKIIDTLK